MSAQLTGPGGVVHRARALLGAYYAYMVEYRAELVLWALSGALPFIMMGVWMKAGSHGGFDMGPVGFARYFLAAFLTRQLTVVWVVWTFEDEVVTGKLSPKLLQPMDPVWHHFASHVAERGARLPFVALLTVVFFALYPASFWIPRALDVVVFLLACALAFGLRFLIQYTFALLAFWTERASAVERAFFLFYLFLSGLIAPLDVFPPAVRAVALWTPFPYLVYLPARMLTGYPVDFARALMVCGLWGVAFLALNRLLWHRGLRHYSAMGA